MSEEKVDFNDKAGQGVVSSEVDSEVGAPVFGDNTLHRTMKNRHIAMLR